MSDPHNDELLGRYIRLTRQIEAERNQLGAEAKAFADALRAADRREIEPANKEAIRLDVAHWPMALQRLIDRSQKLAALANEVNAIAPQIKEPAVTVVTIDPPR